MKRGYKYRIYPTEEQKKYFAQCFGANRWWWNYCLKKIEDNYQEYKAMKENGEDVSKRNKLSAQYDISRELPVLKKEEKTSFLSTPPAISFIYTSQDLDSAYREFYKKNGRGKPKYKKKGNADSFTYQIQKKNVINGKQEGTLIDWKNSTIEVPKAGKVKIIIHRPFNGTIKAATISKESYDYYEMSLLVDDNICELDKKEPTYEGTVGIDLGARDDNNAVLSSGERFETYTVSKKMEKKIKRLQRKLAKAQWIETGETTFSKKWNKEVPVKKPSKNYVKIQEKIAKLKATERRQRTYAAHQITSYITKKDDINTVCVEDLNVKGMTKNHNLAKSITNANMFRIKNQLEYKSKWYGKNFVKIGRFDPSSKKCNVCGYKNDNLGNKETWICPQCGTKHNRDTNAANNIRDWGYKKITEGKQ